MTNIKNISYPVSLDLTEDIENDNVDVSVELEDGSVYVVVVYTIKNIELLMKDGFFSEGPPFIIVEYIEESVIARALEFYIQDNAYWLKMEFLSLWFGSEYLDKKVQELNQVDNVRGKIGSRKVEYEFPLDRLKNSENGKMEVRVELEDGLVCLVSIVTVEYIQSKMEDGFLQSKRPYIIVQKLDDETIRKAIDSYSAEKNGYWLKLDYLFTTFETEYLDQKMKQIEEIYRAIDEA